MRLSPDVTTPAPGGGPQTGKPAALGVCSPRTAGQRLPSRSQRGVRVAYLFQSLPKRAAMAASPTVTACRIPTASSAVAAATTGFLAVAPIPSTWPAPRHTSGFDSGDTALIAAGSPGLGPSCSRRRAQLDNAGRVTKQGRQN